MHLINDLKPTLARLTKLSTLAVASTAVAAAATTWLITGSVNPGQWLAAYEQSRQPAVVHLQEGHQPAAPEATASPASPAVEPSAPPSPDESSPEPAPAQPSSRGDDDGEEAGDD
jgi:hypothetical protein